MLRPRALISVRELEADLGPRPVRVDFNYTNLIEDLELSSAITLSLLSWNQARSCRALVLTLNVVAFLNIADNRLNSSLEDYQWTYLDDIKKVLGKHGWIESYELPIFANDEDSRNYKDTIFMSALVFKFYSFVCLIISD